MKDSFCSEHGRGCQKEECFEWMYELLGWSKEKKNQ